jgi:hypothetical protein
MALKSVQRPFIAGGNHGKAEKSGNKNREKSGAFTVLLSVLGKCGNP